MKVLAIERDVPGVTDKQFTPALLQAEAEHVWALQQEETLREIYFRQDRSSAVLVLECVDVEEARCILAALPLVKANLISFEFIPLRAYPGFERLFTQTTSDRGQTR